MINIIVGALLLMFALVLCKYGIVETIVDENENDRADALEIV